MMISRILGRLPIVTFLIVVLFGCRPTPAPSPQNGKIVFNGEARAALKKHFEKYDLRYHNRKGAEMEEKNDRGYDVEEYEALERLCAQFPTTETFYSAKLTQAMVKASTSAYQDAIALCDEVGRTRTDTWQGIFAMWLKGQVIFFNSRQFQDGIQAAINHHIRLLSEYKKLDSCSEEEFLLLHYRDDPFAGKRTVTLAGSTMISLAQWYARLGNEAKEIEMYKRVLREYPNTHEEYQAKYFLRGR